MDTEILNGDNVLRGGKFQSVYGFEEDIQRTLIAAVAKKGCFIFDRELGSGLFDYIHSGETLSLKQIDSIVRTAASRLENISAEARSFAMNGEKAEIRLEITELDSGTRQERVIVI